MEAWGAAGLPHGTSSALRSCSFQDSFQAACSDLAEERNYIGGVALFTSIKVMEVQHPPPNVIRIQPIKADDAVISNAWYSCWDTGIYA
eukprot:1137847-Pelagomonas_calceolata.AAC.5